MLSIYLDVPYVTQLGIGGNRYRNDWTGCWYASACMLAYYFEAGPRLGDRTLQMADGTHNPILSARHLKRNENLATVPDEAEWKLDGLAVLLRKYGPLLTSFHKTEGKSYKWKADGSAAKPGSVWNATKGSNDVAQYGHCVAMIGVDGGAKKVIFHDPENKPNFKMHISEFNSLYYRAGDGLLRKNVSSHTPKLIAG